MSQQKSMRLAGSVATIGFWMALFLGNFVPEADPVIVTFEIDSQSSINFTTNPPSFTLTFPDFSKGSITNVVSVSYNVSANNVTRTNDMLLARLDDLFPNIALEADFGSYVKLGGNARLVESQPGYVQVTTQDAGLANKVVDQGNGKLIDGHFDMQYRARALEDVATGTHSRILSLTFMEV